ncbi:MAG: Holliday junction resolvase RuvX [Syntrophomonadaceae bacterium]|jgi:putative Holliday junction resolvase
MRIMGLDVGDKRIGVALSDPLKLTAQGQCVIERRSPDADLDRITAICMEYQVGKIVVGLPLNMNGTEGPKALEIRTFARKLQNCSRLPVEFYDERLTTKSAERLLINADVSRKKRKQVIDKLAAVNILQHYLDRGSIK